MARYADIVAVRDALYEADAITMKGVRILNQFPTISPDEVRGVGEWIMLENQSKEDIDNGNYWYTCSHCSAGDLHAKVQEVPFCWKCGARMKGVSEDA